MGIPEHQEPTPGHDDITPNRRNARHRWTVVGMTGAAAVLAGGAFLFGQTRDARQESLPEPKSFAEASGMAAAPAAPEASGPAIAATLATASEYSPASRPASTAESETGERESGRTETGATSAPKKHPAKDVRGKIDRASAMAKADGFGLQRPLTAVGDSETTDEFVSEWTESFRTGTVRVTIARHDLTGSAALLSAGDSGKSVGDGVKCTDNVLTDDAPPAERPTLLLCWRTSSKRSVVTLMAMPNGEPSPAADISIINREWVKLH